ncbi:MAG: ribonuclease HII [Candidatus Daviesbacteria bacterium]|nr:ribonuclease HII [Candidatus Daviesbacteria bacterium]
MILPTLNIEKDLWKSGHKYICGLDEVGRGCFAGPVVVGAVIFPSDVVLPEGIADSKLLTPLKRKNLESRIKNEALCWAVGEISVDIINEKGIGEATQLAFALAVKNLAQKPDFCLIDAFHIKYLEEFKQKAIKNGDKICASISAGSIIAKVYRDELMVSLHDRYPEYGFSKHKGYGTLEHRNAIKKHGLSRVHRKSFNLDKFL